MPVIARLRRDDDGFTLIELLVIIIIFGIVSGIIATTMIYSMRSTRLHQNRVYAAEDVQVQIERMGRDLRVADPIRAASATSMTVDLYRGAGCVREQWSVVGTTLQVTQKTYAAWASCSVYPATAAATSTSTRTALSRLANGATPVFTYADSTGAALSSPTPSKVATVTITLVESVVGRPGTVQFSTAVGVRNEALS